MSLATPDDLLAFKLFGSPEPCSFEEREQMLLFLKSCQTFTLQPQEFLLKQGEDNYRLFLILRGALDIHLDSVDEESIATLHPGDCVGEFSMVDRQPASAHVLAVEETEVLSLDLSQFMKLVEMSTAITINMMSLLVHRLRQGNLKLSKSRALRSHFEEQIYFDGLTGAYNRYWLDRQLPQIMKQCRDKDWPLSLVMFDIDHFKSFNDNFGHRVGDIVLTGVVEAILNQIRDSDFLARYGGEEFTVLLPRTDEAVAATVAERLRKLIEELALVKDDGGSVPQVTSSFGFCVLRPEHTPESLIHEADVALYASKRGGRNRVTLYTPTLEQS
jgi:diguanylate cyclase (GGDEF)-like protein